MYWKSTCLNKPLTSWIKSELLQIRTHVYFGFCERYFQTKVSSKLSTNEAFPACPRPPSIKTRTPVVTMSAPTFSKPRFSVPSCLHSIAQVLYCSFFTVLLSLFISRFWAIIILKNKIRTFFLFKVQKVLSCVTQKKLRAWLILFGFFNENKEQIKSHLIFLKDCLVLWLYVRNLLKTFYFL